MPLSIEYYPVAGTVEAPVTVTKEGIFVPANQLPGLLPADLEPEDNDKESKVIRSLLSTFAQGSIGQSFLGIAFITAAPVAAGANLFNQTYLFSETRMGNLRKNTLAPIPLATIGTRANEGELVLTYFFENVRKVAASTSVTEPGVLIPTSSLIPYGSPTQENLVVISDSRSWLTALIGHIVFDATRRSAATPSAIVAASKVSTTILTPPPSFTAVENPTTGVLAAELPLRVFVTSTYSISVQVQINPSMAPVNNVTA